LNPSAPKDLVVLTADKDAKLTFEELLCRHRHLDIRPIEADVFAHGRHDAGVLRRCEEFLRPFLKWKYALVVFDHEGCGRENQPREAVEQIAEANLTVNGWHGRSCAVAISPELEAWLWDQTCQVNQVFDWPGGVDELKRWMRAQSFAQARHAKPRRPKEAFDAALAARRIPHSSALFRQLAKTMKFQDCQDPAFRKLVMTLQLWFSAL
jgi:hypothetical protein